jgi:hypothetical protein
MPRDCADLCRCVQAPAVQEKKKGRKRGSEQQPNIFKSNEILVASLYGFIYPNLSVRLKNYTVFIRVSLFFALKTEGFSAFFPCIFSPRQERRQLMYTIY